MRLMGVARVDFSKKSVKPECRCHKSFLKSHVAMKAELGCGTLPLKDRILRGIGGIKTDVLAYSCAQFYLLLTQARII